ncbi:MAG: cytochrome c oxidase subunit II [Solirubrobacteraceae bacterium]|jgi:cytochrome c oxidase subunit 2
MAAEAPQNPPVDSGGRYHIRRVLSIWAVLSVVFVALTILVVPLVERKPASSFAGFASLTDLVFTAIAVPVALFVWVFVFYSVFAFREKSPEGGRIEDLQDGPPLEAQPRQQIAWLAVTTVLAFFTVGWGMFGFYKETTKSAANALVVNVTGQEWTWTYAYPKLGVQSHILELPLGRPVQFRVTSDDVLHGFGLAALGIAMDANPGEWVATPVVTPNKAGTFEVRCIELCGLYHTFMWSQVKVVPPSSFAAWIKASGGNSSVLRSPGGGAQKAIPAGNEVEEIT